MPTRAALAALLAALPAFGQGLGDWIKKASDKAVEMREKKRRERVPTSTAAVRGLEEDGKGGDAAARDYAALDWLESLEVTKAELAKFVKEGRLAP